ncbi:cyclic GMP-AMP synthase DncV-like nucleotidyltransferase [Corallococcus terminator]|uniref:cyclic GMP-AMP synthase DncV-like nucleotidyltransferase n=1 Tax=Corallococcus terminator TaxID=2316733 RepID=UPI0011C467B7|nr:hypothetical protein [Corallococcus terminator]
MSADESGGVYGVQGHFETFYRDHVRLGMELKQELANHRDACLGLLEKGLRKLGEKRRGPAGYPGYVRKLNQGSYAMHTLNQHRRKQYDIDVAVIFKKEDLPNIALRARQRVAEALRASLNNFATKPIARTNAVTVWYTQGEHVDLAVYRESRDSKGRPVLEHASAQWRPRDPEAVNAWFEQRNQGQSPVGGHVGPGQFQRVVRLLKAFARSRVSWELPGGMILSALASEVYQPDPERDDAAFYKTLVVLQARLKESLEVRSPVAVDESLTSRPQTRAQVGRLLEKLDFVLPQLEVLKSSVCLEARALSAWDQVFNHPYWKKQAAQARMMAARESPAPLKFRISHASSMAGPVTRVYKDKTLVPTGGWLRCSLKKRFEFTAPFRVHWLVRKAGVAASGCDAPWRSQDGEGKDFWHEAGQSGRYSIICSVIKDGHVVARGVRHVRVSGG